MTIFSDLVEHDDFLDRYVLKKKLRKNQVVASKKVTLLLLLFSVPDCYCLVFLIVIAWCS